MKTEVHLIGGKVAPFGEDAVVRMTDRGVEIMERNDDEPVKVLFPWSQIEKVLQRGAGVDSVYTF